MANTPFVEPELVKKGAFVDWRGKYPGGFGWRHNISLRTIHYPVFHHSVTPRKNNAKTEVDFLWQIHRNRGWGGIGYNFVITTQEKNGYAVVAYVGDLANARAHTPNQKGAKGIRQGYGNNHLLGICFIGSFHTGQLPSKAQLRSAHLLTRELIFRENSRLPGIPDSWARNSGHQQFDWTACPTNQLSKMFAEVVKATPIVPPPVKPPVIPPYANPKNRKVFSKRNVRLYGDTNLVDLRNGKRITTLVNKTTLDVEAEVTYGGKSYYLTTYRVKKLKADNWNKSSDGWGGFNVAATIKPDEATPDPVPPVEVEPPVKPPEPPVDPPTEPPVDPPVDPPVEPPVDPEEPGDGTTPYPPLGEEGWLKNLLDKIADEDGIVVGLIKVVIDKVTRLFKRLFAKG